MNPTKESGSRTASALFDRRKSGFAAFSSRMQPTARRLCPFSADKAHTCGLRSVFSDVDAAGENGFYLLRACGRELCEAFSTK
ncbi:MAG: hypothetical protein E6626_09460 [Flavonifractor plautii]|nr:hypothetical protein [Flavonifractor plautii]